MSRLCSAGHANDDAQKFCGECGMPLTPPEVTGVLPPPDAAPATADAGPAGPPSAPPTATGQTGSRRGVLIAVGAVLFVLVAGATALLVSQQSRPSATERYLEDLEEEGLDDGFPTDRAAVIAAESTCEQAERTGDPRGGRAEQLAVTHFCDEWAEDFTLLETITVAGSFSILDIDEYLFYDDGDPCEGEGGYGDINASTRVLVSDEGGEILARTSLGGGEATDGSCVFTFEVSIEEGEDQYVIEVGDRGEVAHTFEELQEDGIELSLG